MKERPILFSAPMVRSLLDSSKTQTRRIMKPQPKPIPTDSEHGEPGFWIPFKAAQRMVRNEEMAWGCPYGQPGDRLWVKETWRTAAEFDSYSPTKIAEKCKEAGYKKPWAPIQYLADGQRDNWSRSEWPKGDGKTRVSIHMTRWASRITLEITGVRGERLNDCSDADALAEGVCRTNTSISGYAQERYRRLWESINGEKSWDANPWVWVIEFRRLTAWPHKH